MAKIPRITQKVFAGSPGFEQVAEFGSLAAAAPVFTVNAATIQSLGAWTGGWFDAVIGGSSPAIEDMNGFCLVVTQQLAYGLQQGIPEWDAGTTYYVGSVVSQPVVVFAVTSANATLGATYTNNSITFTVQATIAAGTILVCTASGLPTSSGTLTKASGTGDATITFSANTPGVQLYVSLTNTNLNQAVTNTSQWYKISPEPGIANSALITNSSGTGTAYALLTNTNIAAGAAIAYSKLNLTGDIVDADISATAAIEGSKIVAATASVAGAMTASAQDFGGEKTFHQGINELDYLSLGTTFNGTNFIATDTSPGILFKRNGTSPGVTAFAFPNTTAGAIVTLNDAMEYSTTGAVNFPQGIGLAGGSLLNFYSAPAAYTPTVTANTVNFSVTYTVQYGYWTQIGKLVFFNAFVQWTNNTTAGSGSVTVNLPVQAQNVSNAQQIVSVEVSNFTSGSANLPYFIGEIDNNSSNVLLVACNGGLTPSAAASGGLGTLSTNALTGVTRSLSFSGCYIAK